MGSYLCKSGLTQQPIALRAGWRCTFPHAGRDGLQAEGIKVIPVALKISASAGAGGPVLVLSGEADQTTTEMLREMLAAQLGTGARLVTVDASGLSFLDSASLLVLVRAARALQARNGRLVLARPQPVVARLLEITGADRLLNVQESAGPAGSLLARTDSPGCSSPGYNCVHGGPAGRTDPARTDPDGYDASC